MGLFSKLQNGDTVLKSLKFGKDRLGGGDSNQPYITKPIDQDPGQLSQIDGDFLTRGGLTAPRTAAEDVLRMTKYMFDLKSPSGILFGVKQNLLSRISPKTEASKGAAYAGGALNEGVYTPLSTIAQSGVGFTGTHLNKQGIDPTGLIEALSIKKYEDVVKSQDENRLVTLANLTAEGRSQNNFNFIKGYSLNKGNDVVTYGGGPGSILGIGQTHIRFADQRTGVNNILAKNPETFKYFYEGGLTRPKTVVDYYNTLGVSEKYGLTGTQLGLTIDGQFLGRYYNAEAPYSTLSRDDQGLTLLGSDGYQANKLFKNITQQSDTTYYSPIENILLGYKRQLLSPLLFDVGDTWEVTTKDGIPIFPYSSYNTLVRDYTNTDVSNAGGGLWKDFNNGSKQHKDGYLADTDKNAGSWAIGGVYYANQNNAYPGGIAPDFRTTPRDKRGLYPLPPGAQNLDQLDPLPGYDTGQGETFSKYHNNAGKLNKDTIQRIYYRSNNSSFAKSKNTFVTDEDIISFNISILNPANPSQIKKLNFRAYLDGMTDSYDADWKSQVYIGVAEKFWKYNSFGRDMSFTLTVVADNPDYLDSMYSNLNILAGSIAPTYTGQGYMAGNIHKLTIGNLIKNQYGIITGLTYDIMDDSPWDLTPGRQLPYYIKVTSIKFTPIHDFRPESEFNKKHSYLNQA